MKIWFDMDGTIADLYGVKSWLDRLRAYDPTPYEEAEPLCSMKALAKLLKALQKRGYEIGIISWTSAESTADYDRRVEWAKYHWLRSHLKAVNFDHILFTPYGVDKKAVTGGGVLFDDNENIREDWTDEDNMAFTPAEIFEVLRGLL